MRKAEIAVVLPVLAALLSANLNTVAHAQGDLVAPGNVVAQNTGNPGEVVRISWDGVPSAAYYRIGWVAYSDVAPIIASSGDWLEHFAFIDIENRGQTGHLITRLTPGVQYAFIVASNDGRYGTPRWPKATGWRCLNLAQAPASQAAIGTASVNVTWDAVAGVTYYRIGWVVYEDVAPIIAAVGDWLERFAFIDIANRGQTAHTITRLTPGLRYAFIVAGNDGRYGAPQWPDASGWQFMTPAAEQPGDDPPIPEELSCPLPWVPKATPPAATVPGDYDADDDGLVEVATLAQFRSINSSGYSSLAFPNALPGMGCPEEGCTGYELVVDIDFDTNGNGVADRGDVLWNDGEGWRPIEFAGTLDGNGHTISNLFIDRKGIPINPQRNVGLFSATSGVIRNVSLVSVNVRGGTYVGGLAGSNQGEIKDSCVQGSVTAYLSIAGGLVGANSGEIDTSYSDTATQGPVVVGGLVGGNGGSITRSVSTGTVSVRRVDSYYINRSSSFGGRSVGGLAGRNSGGSIMNSQSVVDVTGTRFVGGLVGENFGSIYDSGAAGTVFGEEGVGGLVGVNSIDFGVNIHSSFATGAVTAREKVGGLVGENRADIVGNYATGSVSGTDKVGGLAGETQGDITASYATGRVTGDFRVGGLVGIGHSLITASYATGTVSGSSPVGGLIGTNFGGVIDSYWDTVASGQSLSDGGQGQPTSELQSPTGYTGIYANWNVNDSDPWDFGTSNQYPVLKYGGLNPAHQRR